MGKEAIERRINWSPAGEPFLNVSPYAATLLWVLVGARELYRNYDLLAPQVENIPGYIAAATIFVIGRLVDDGSTIRRVKRERLAEGLGIDHGVYEGNPFLSKQPTEKDLFSRRRIILHSVCSFLCTAMPPVGIGVGIGSIAAAINSEYKARVIERKIREVKLSQE